MKGPEHTSGDHHTPRTSQEDPARNPISGNEASRDEPMQETTAMQETVQDEEASRDVNRIYLKQLGRLLARYSGFSNPESSEHTAGKQQSSQSKEKSGWLNLLVMLPWLLAGLFVFSFFRDLDGYTITLLGNTYALDGLLRIVSVSGMIGFLTNWAAITMLFKPRRRHPILGQGLVPAHKERIADRLARAVSADLINPEMIKQKIRESEAIRIYREKATHYVKQVVDHPDFRSELKQWTVDYVDSMVSDPQMRADMARRVVQELEPTVRSRTFAWYSIKTYTFFKGTSLQELVEDTLRELPQAVEQWIDRIDEMLDKLPGRLEFHAEEIEATVTMLLHQLVNRLDVYAMVEENLRRYDESRLEALIKGATHDQLRYIQYLGALFGTVGGLVIWEPLVSLVVLGLLFALFFGLDYGIMAVKNRQTEKQPPPPA